MSEIGSNEVLDTVETTEDVKPNVSNKDVKEHQVFKKVAKELSETRAELEALRSAQMESAKVSEIEKARQEQALESLVSQRDNEIKSLKDAFDRQQKESEIRLLALKAGVNSDLVLEGIVSRFHKDKPESSGDWLNELVEKEALVKSNAQESIAIASGPSGRVSRSANPTAELVARVKSGKPNPGDTSEMIRLISEGKIDSLGNIK
jgi:hypothetical protein